MPHTKNDPIRTPEDTAAACPLFRFDCEEECEDDTVSCRNCRHRRWTRGGFVCMKEKDT